MPSKQVPTVWACGYAGKTGLSILSADDRFVKVSAKSVGNMFAPDPQEFVEKFLGTLHVDDIVISPSGPNDTYLAGVSNHGNRIFWVHPGTLADLIGAKVDVPAELLKLYADSATQRIFYPYTPNDAAIAKLRDKVFAFLAAEQQAIGAGNALSQKLRRERDFAAFQPADRDSFVREFVGREARQQTARCKRAGIVLVAEQKQAVRQAATARAEQQFEFLTTTDEQRAATLRSQLVKDQSEWFGSAPLLEEVEKAMKKFVHAMPHDSFFAGILSDGALRTKAELLAYIRTPLAYPNVNALLAALGIGHLKDGQVVQRRKGEAHKGSPRGRRLLCFTGTAKVWQNDPVGFMRDLYYAYKGCQTYKFWDLMTITTEVWSLLGMRAEDDNPHQAVAAIEYTDSSRNADIYELALCLKALVDEIEMVKAQTDAIDELCNTATKENLRWLFARGRVRKSGQDVWGKNLQLTPKRIEQQVKRYLGITLARTTYYRWLEQLNQPLPLADDRDYTRMWRYVHGYEDGVPNTFDPHVILQYHQQRLVDLAEARTTAGLDPLPDEITQKFVVPSDREAAA